MYLLLGLVGPCCSLLVLVGGLSVASRGFCWLKFGCLMSQEVTGSNFCTDIERAIQLYEARAVISLGYEPRAVVLSGAAVRQRYLWPGLRIPQLGLWR